MQSDTTISNHGNIGIPSGPNPTGAAFSGVAGYDENARYHHLDAVRAFALMLGVVFHAAESFGPNNHYWAIVDCSPSDFLEWFRFACHSFRMELFFLIAGFFARLLIHRRGESAFIRNRTQRILVPLAVGWVVLYPIIVYIWLWGWSVSGQLADLGVPPEARHLPLWQLVMGFFITGGFIKKFDLAHLWFLHQLLVLYVAMLGLRWGWKRLDATGNKSIRLDAWFSRLCSWRGTFLFFVAVSVPVLLLMNSWGVDTPKESLLPHAPTTLLYGVCFLAGWMLHRQPVLLERFEQRWAWHMTAAIVFWVVFGLFNDRIPYRQMNPGQLMWTRVAYTTLFASMMWCFSLGFLGWFTRFFKQSCPWVRYVADASYWVYLVHLPLVVALQVAVGRVALPWPVKYAIILGVAIPLLFGSYHYLVRGTFIGAQLNGRRYPLKWPWQAGGPNA
jgi:hypothetical protein